MQLTEKGLIKATTSLCSVAFILILLLVVFCQYIV